MNNPMVIGCDYFWLLILTTNISNILHLASKGGVFVVQEQVSTGNLNLDKEMNKFYHCISKTHDDPPSIQSIDNCWYQPSIGYYQTSTGGISGSNNNNNIQYNNGETHSTTVGSLRVVPPPGVLVEVTQSP